MHAAYNLTDKCFLRAKFLKISQILIVKAMVLFTQSIYNTQNLPEMLLTNSSVSITSHSVNQEVDLKALKSCNTNHRLNQIMKLMKVYYLLINKRHSLLAQPFH